MNTPTGGNKSSRNALGRGLSALIPTAPPAGTSVASSKPVEPAQRTLPIERIVPNKGQPRKTFEKGPLEELAESIRQQGVLQPIIVRSQGTEYEIVAGERRWRASQIAGLKQVPVVIKDLSEEDVMKVALIENIQREDLDPIEEAQAYSGLMRGYGLTQESVAAAVGKKRATVANCLRLLKLPEPVLELLAEGAITAGHARAIMTLGDERHMHKLAKDVVERKLSVRDAEALARKRKQASKPAKQNEQSHAERAVEERLMRKLSTKVRLVQRKGKGRIEIFFHSLDQLDDILGQID
jgi:ParB family chromosome partitioning protein